MRKTDQILQTALKLKTTTFAPAFATSEPVYVNVHLRPKNKMLLGTVVQKNNKKTGKFVWVDSGDILMRKTEKSKYLHITTKEDTD